MVGLADPSVGINVLRGGEVAFLNQAFGNTGRSYEGHPTYLPSPDGTSWGFFYARFYNLKLQGVSTDRGFGHDPQALYEMLRAGKERTAEVVLEYLDAAQANGIKCIVTLGGFSDVNTAAQAFDLFRPETALYRDFVELAAFVADKISGHPALIVLELLNEPDFMTAVKGYWLPKFAPAMRGELKDDNGKPIPADPYALVKGFALWNDGLISMVKNKQTRPGTPIGMGTALDSNIWCDPNGVPRMDWDAEKRDPVIIPMLSAGCSALTPHLYLNEDNDVHRSVLKGQKVPAFVAAARKTGKPLIVGETGDLWNGGTFDPWISAMFDAYPVEYCVMIRWWDPTAYRVPMIPKRIPYAPAEPEPPTPPIEEPSQPDDPAPEQPNEPDPPSPDEPGRDTEDPVEEPPPVEEDEPPAEEPTEDPPEVEEPPIVVPDEPEPLPGRGFVLFRIVEAFLKILGKLRRGGKK